ncbi:MAG TPA: ribbon-helix-helix protein, CopG family [Candidatus Ozemobacteraceae bacterium]|nr:ribbon-helix-helix protein, CopG family [Candidatus Ozemobacteraceae bacterium]
MPRKQIRISEEQLEVLQLLAARTGKNEGELINEALERYLESAEEHRKLSDLMAAAGLWKDREDLPDTKILRREWDARPLPSNTHRKRR